MKLAKKALGVSRLGVLDEQAATKINPLFKPQGPAPFLTLKSLYTCIANHQIVLRHSFNFEGGLFVDSLSISEEKILRFGT